MSATTDVNKKPVCNRHLKNQQPFTNVIARS